MGPNSQTILGQSCEDNFRTDDNLITYILRQNLMFLLDVLRQLGSESQDTPIVVRFILKYVIR